MNRKLVKLSVVLLSVLLSFNVIFGGCSCNGDDEDKTATSRGTHIQKITETDKKIISDGKTDYSILVASDKSEKIDIGVEDFIFYFEKATGLTLAVVTDESYDASKKYFSFGTTSLLTEKGFAAEDRLGDDGYCINTKDDSIFVYGKKDSGAMYGAYELLNKLFNFETYYLDCYSLNKDVTDLTLCNYEILEIPDFVTRATGYEVMTANPSFTRRLKKVPMWDLFEDLDPNDGVIDKVHNSLLILDQEVYNTPEKPETYHPKWFLKSKCDYKANQICFTAHGDEQEWNLMMETAAAKMINCFKNSKKHISETIRIQFDISDNALYCKCESCMSEQEKYGSYAALNIKVCNKLSDLIEEWMNSDEGKQYKRDFEIYFLAYEMMTPPPLKYNESTGEYVPTITCKKNVVPIYAPAHMDFLQSINAEINLQYKLEMEKWKLVCDNSFLWTYSTNFNHYLIMYDNFGEMQEFYQFAYDNGFKAIREESQDGQYGGATGFLNLKTYLQCKLSWKVDEDYNTLIDNFFDNYFGPASDVMQELFNQNRIYFAGLKADEELGFGGHDSIYYKANDPDYWKKQVVYGWIEQTEKAIEAIAPLKEKDSSSYSIYYDHIALERISYLFVLSDVYEKELTTQELNNVRSTLKEDILRIGLTRSAEHNYIADLIRNW